MTRNILLPMTAIAALALAASAQAQPAPQEQSSGMQSQQDLPMNKGTDVGSGRIACTGVGDNQEHNPRWSSYPVKLVVSGNNHEYYAGEHVSVTGRGGEQVADVTCNGPWVMMKLDPGAYRATVDLPGHATKNVKFTAPSRGQREVNVIFRENEADLGGQHRASEAGFQKPADTSTSQQPR